MIIKLYLFNNAGNRTLAVVEDDTLRHMNLFGNALFGRILAMNGAIDTTNPRRYYLKDHLGSTRAVVDDQGSVLETFDYYPFGLLMPKRSSTSGNTIEKFTGKERDEEGGINLDYFRARYYDPALGRWHNPDPVAEKFPAWSPYNYALNNPIANADPDGREVECKTREDCERAAEELNKAHEGETNITVEEFEKEVTKTKWYDPFNLFGTAEKETVTAYRLSTEESDFDFSQNEFTSGLYDVINSKEITFDLEIVPPNTQMPQSPTGYTAFQIQGRNYPRPGGGTVIVGSSNRLNEPVGVVLMHELVGHGHPAGDNRALDVNDYYQSRLGYRLSDSRGISIGHGGYLKSIGWKRTRLYKKSQN